MPVTERSAPVELFRVVMPARVVLAVPAKVATPEVIDAIYWEPLARSKAVVRSPTFATEFDVAGSPRYTVELPVPSVTTLPETPDPVATAPAAAEPHPP